MSLSLGSGSGAQSWNVLSENGFTVCGIIFQLVFTAGLRFLESFLIRGGILLESSIFIIIISTKRI